MIPRVQLVHRARGRLRLRVPERRKDQAWLRHAAHRLETIRGVESVEIGLATASLLVRHLASEDIEPRVRALDIWSFDKEGQESPAALEQLSDAFGLLNQQLRGLTENRTDLQTLAFLLLVVFSIAQILRGKLMAPAVSMLWYAFELASRREDPRSGEPGS